MIRGLLLNLVVFGGYLLGAAMISVLPNVITLGKIFVSSVAGKYIVKSRSSTGFLVLFRLSRLKTVRMRISLVGLMQSQ